MIRAPERDGAGNKTISPGDHLHGFEVSGATGRFTPAQARIEGNTVVVWSPQQSMPVEVRY